MTRFVENVVRDPDEAWVIHGQSRLLRCLSARAVIGALSEVEVATGRRPRTFAVNVLTALQQQPFAAGNEDADADPRVRIAAHPGIMPRLSPLERGVSPVLPLLIRATQPDGLRVLTLAAVTTTAEAGDILHGSYASERRGSAAMDDVRRIEEGVPPAVGIAAIIGFGKAVFEGGFGLLGILIANSLDDSFGVGLLVFGIVYAIASLLLWRGSRAGYYITVVLSALGLIVAVIYLFRSESAVFGATLVAGLLNALVLYLLLWRKSAREYFAR